MWSYAKRAIGTHVLRQKHWPGNAMMHPPDPNTFATSVAIRSVQLVVCVALGTFATVALVTAVIPWRPAQPYLQPFTLTREPLLLTCS